MKHAPSEAPGTRRARQDQNRLLQLPGQLQHDQDRRNKPTGKCKRSEGDSGASTLESATAAIEAGTTSKAGECHATPRSESQSPAAEVTTAAQEAATDGAAATEAGTTARHESQSQAAEATTAAQEASADGAATAANREGRQVAGSEGQSQAKQTKTPTSAGKKKRARKIKRQRRKATPDKRKAAKQEGKKAV